MIDQSLKFLLSWNFSACDFKDLKCFQYVLGKEWECSSKNVHSCFTILGYKANFSWFHCQHTMRTLFHVEDPFVHVKDPLLVCSWWACLHSTASCSVDPFHGLHWMKSMASGREHFDCDKIYSTHYGNGSPLKNHWVFLFGYELKK